MQYCHPFSSPLPNPGAEAASTLVGRVPQPLMVCALIPPSPSEGNDLARCPFASMLRLVLYFRGRVLFIPLALYLRTRAVAWGISPNPLNPPSPCGGLGVINFFLHSLCFFHVEGFP
jgi:hypothetical protein